ncbi:hypothetical protein [Streptomyces sp. YGL11-2]
MLSGILLANRVPFGFVAQAGLDSITVIAAHAYGHTADALSEELA